MISVWRARTADPWGRAQAGQGLGEYALIIVLVALGVFVLLALLGTQLGSTFSAIVASIDATTP
jgi:Flp pilus assembly pilin Flp